MIVDDLDVFGAGVGPAENDPPLVVNANRMLASEVSLQGFEPIARRRGEIAKALRGIDLQEFSSRHAGDAGRDTLRNAAADKDSFGE